MVIFATSIWVSITSYFSSLVGCANFDVNYSNEVDKEIVHHQQPPKPQVVETMHAKSSSDGLLSHTLAQLIANESLEEEDIVTENDFMSEKDVAEPETSARIDDIVVENLNEDSLVISSRVLDEIVGGFEDQYSSSLGNYPSKSYKSYQERMRKFDDFFMNLKMMGFLEHKDSLQSFAMEGHSTRTCGSILSQHLRLHKRRRRPEEDLAKFVRELQMCISLEFLHLQYGKTKELLESDPHEIRNYNLVAEKFQQFQVLMQRFFENETFRIQYYITNHRIVLQKLPRVGLVKEDPMDKIGMEKKVKGILRGENL
ncbi:hypothetical protein Scep_011247 [Stephania cephalantha]|uniref:Uncharacterized protein n=1 Tax=Stephania cephalantha TaxID=152367 RepID=A0AAP0JCZ5_9MAGN